ncbi:TonB family protein [Pleionea sp. CnH1-48]|uniref:TonB family protein n=1 Tax=Pleionea sp. CnH1-48 TaxID=2954494 RepID=UPI0020971936|nr:TonB family protein [Pleionea sp. CnH1-48]MCO7224010.1 TonB family protein [Pleionea sp. CnH1-48]
MLNKIFTTSSFSSVLLLTLVLIITASFYSSDVRAEKQKVILNDNGITLNLQGTAVYKNLREDIYIAQLFATGNSLKIKELMQDDVAKRMSLRIMQDRISARSFTRLWKERIAINNERAVWQPFGSEIAKFTKAIAYTYEKGDQVDIELLPNEAIKVYIDKVEFYKTTNLAFYNLLLSTWIGEIPPTKAFKKDITSDNSTDKQEELLALYDTLVPIEGRIQPEFSEPAIVDATNIAANATKAVTGATNVAAAPTEKKPEVKKPVKQTKKPAPKPKQVASTKSNNKSSKPKTETPKKVAKKEPVKTSRNTAPKEKAVAATPPPKVVRKPKIKVAPQIVVDEADLELDTALIQGEYIRKLVQTIKRNQKFPSRAWRLKMEGDGAAIVTINNGRIVGQQIWESTNYKLLDRAILDMIKKTEELPPLPKELKGETFEFTINVSFSRRGR